MSILGTLPERQVRARAGLETSPPPALISAPASVLPEDAQIVCLGSRLAPALGAVLETRGFRRIRTDSPHPALPAIEPEADEYQAYGTLAGPMGSPVAIEQLIRRALGEFKPAEDRWHQGDLVIDPFRPHLRYPARSDREFDVLTERYLTGMRSALRRAKAVVIALDTIEVCEAVADGAVLPVWPETLDAERHRMRMLTSKEVGEGLRRSLDVLRRINPGVHLLLMVSPEPVPATLTPRHILAADAVIKATLRLAVEEMLTMPGVFYVPAAELAAHMGIAAGGAIGDPTFLSALAEAVISTQIVAPVTPAPIEERPAPEPEPAGDPAAAPAKAEPSARAQTRRGKARAAATDAVAPEAAQEARAPTEKKGRRRKAKAEAAQTGAIATVAPIPEQDGPAAEAGPRIGGKRGRRREARAATQSDAEGTPAGAEAETGSRSGRRRAAQPAEGDEAAGSGRTPRGTAKRNRRAAQDAEAPASPKAVLAAPVDESGYQDPKRKRGRRATGEQAPAEAGDKRKGRRKKEA